MDATGPVEPGENPIRHLEDRIGALEANERRTADLHDTVIQHLFAAGMSIQAQLPGSDPATADRLGHAISLIDDSIAALSESIFGPRRDGFGT